MIPLSFLHYRISTHTLTWSVTHSTLCWHVWKGFQLTRSRGAWPGNQVRRISTQRHFNSHAHVERDALSRCLTRWRIWISTHTLTWSVTSWRSACRAFQNFNSHAHVERDLMFCVFSYCAVYFNSHAHVERDLACFHFFELLCQFQLTRSRGAWRPSPPIWAKTSEFQLTRSRGAWRSSEQLTARCFSFQLTRSRGAWLNSYGIFCLVWNFNSHAHVERDSSGCSNFLIWAYFNSHAHVERDMWRSRPQNRLWISTHTLTWSVTERFSFRSQWNLISTHTLTWSVTASASAQQTEADISTHTLTWSVTWNHDMVHDSQNHFNSHAHVERDIAFLISLNSKWISTHTLTWSVTWGCCGW